MVSRRTMVLTAFALLVLAVAGPAPAQETLRRQAGIGPWPWATKLTAFRGRVWFVNSVRFPDHNSADVLSLDPVTGGVRFERHLFSQDLGSPAVAAGLLYWPFEDPRTTFGFGLAAVTSGPDWQLLTLPVSPIFHVHAMAAGAQGRLWAATSAWRARILRSDDGGRTWRQLYRHPELAGKLSRIYGLAAQGGRLYADLLIRGGGQTQSRLMVLVDGDLAPLPGWPDGGRVWAMAQTDAALFALHRGAGRTDLMRIDQGRAAVVAGPPGGTAVALAAEGARLYALTRRGQTGRVWRREPAGAWTAIARFSGGTAESLAVLGGRPYLGGQTEAGRAALWRPNELAPELREPEAVAILPPADRPAEPRDWVAEGKRLDRLFADLANYAEHGRVLRDAVFDVARAGPPAGFFAARLGAALPADQVPLLGGKVHVAADKIGRWLLLWGLGMTQREPVPLAYLQAPWTAKPNRFRKYLEPTPIALWAAAWSGQDDRRTLDAIVGRLDRPGDPPWLAGDLIGALTALTGQRFGYDTGAWRDWWATARAAWRHS